MPKVSKFNIDQDLETEILKQFWYFISKANNSLFVEKFYSDFLTNTEKLMLAKRFATAILISSGKTPSVIHESIHVTYSTIGSVSSWLRNANPETKKFFENIIKEKQFEKISDKVDELLDKMPLAPYTNWSNTLKRRAQNNKVRSVKKSLR